MNTLRSVESSLSEIRNIAEAKLGPFAVEGKAEAGELVEQQVQRENKALKIKKQELETGKSEYTVSLSTTDDPNKECKEVTFTHNENVDPKQNPDRLTVFILSGSFDSLKYHTVVGDEDQKVQGLNGMVEQLIADFPDQADDQYVQDSLF